MSRRHRTLGAFLYALAVVLAAWVLAPAPLWVEGLVLLVLAGVVLPYVLRGLLGP